MGAPFYRASFEKQLTGSALGGSNCGAASGAMLADQFTLGLKNPSPDAFRKATGDTVGGMPISTIGSTLEQKYGVGVTVYDASDGYTFDELVADLKRGKFAVVNGDYDQVPDNLSGQPTFDGLHSEFWHRVLPTGIVVGDPLCDGRWSSGRRPKGYVVYPLSVARDYVEKFDRQVPGTGIHAAVMDRQRVKSRGRYGVNVRVLATTSSGVLGVIRGSTSLVWGGTVRGQSIGGNSTWYRVWYPRKNTIAYVHSSVVKKI